VARLYDTFICKVGVTCLDFAIANALVVFAGRYSIHGGCPGAKPPQAFQNRPQEAILDRIGIIIPGKRTKKASSQTEKSFHIQSSPFLNIFYVVK
jgi:hypothetical protein